MISISKTSSNKIVALICFMKFLSPDVALYLYRSTMRPRMEDYCHVWSGAPSCYLELLEKQQKAICRTADPSFAAPLEPLAHRRNVAISSFSYWYYFVDVLENWLNWFHFLFVEGGLVVILIDCMAFLSIFIDDTRMSMSTVFFHA